MEYTIQYESILCCTVCIDYPNKLCSIYTIFLMKLQVFFN